MKRLPAVLSFLIVAIAHAQGIPNGGSISIGQGWGAAQGAVAWQSTGVASPAATGTPIVNGIPLSNYPETSVEMAVSATPDNYTYPPGHAWRYGVLPSAGDQTAAMIKAHSTGYRIYYPTGVYTFNSGVSIPCGGIVGDGPFATVFNSTSVTKASLFNYSCGVNAAAAGNFENFGVEAKGMAGGYALTITAPAGEAQGTRIVNVLTAGIPNGISFIAASQWSVINSRFLNTAGDAITINNTNGGDSGDSVIIGCYFASTSRATIDVHQTEAGGLKIIGNKFNGYGIGYLLDLGAVSTSDLLIIGNSFENGYIAAIKFQRTSGTATFSNITITGDQFLINSASNTSAGIYSVPSSAFLSNVTISGDVFKHDDTGASQSIDLDYVTNAQISGNTLAGAGGSSTGVLMGSHNSNVTVSANNVSGFGTNLSGAGAQMVAALTGTSGSIGGSALAAGACTSGSAFISGATTSMVAVASPNTYPGDGNYWDARVTASGTVTVKVCAAVAQTPTASTYNVRILQ
jgi:hypothetical protein